MSEAKFTPGPWSFSEFGSCNNWLVGADGSTVYHVDDYGNELPNDADSRLIAAAPDLYEALFAISCLLHQRPDILAALRPLMGPAEQETFKRATIALCKAHGETP